MNKKIKDWFKAILIVFSILFLLYNISQIQLLEQYFNENVANLNETSFNIINYTDDIECRHYTSYWLNQNPEWNLMFFYDDDGTGHVISYREINSSMMKYEVQSNNEVYKIMAKPQDFYKFSSYDDYLIVENNFVGYTKLYIKHYIPFLF